MHSPVAITAQYNSLPSLNLDKVQSKDYGLLHRKMQEEAYVWAFLHLYSGTDLGSTKDGKEKPVPGTALALPRLLLLEETIC